MKKRSAVSRPYWHLLQMGLVLLALLILSFQLKNQSVAQCEKQIAATKAACEQKGLGNMLRRQYRSTENFAVQLEKAAASQNTAELLAIGASELGQWAIMDDKGDILLRSDESGAQTAAFVDVAFFLAMRQAPGARVSLTGEFPKEAAVWYLKEWNAYAVSLPIDGYDELRFVSAQPADEIRMALVPVNDGWRLFNILSCIVGFVGIGGAALWQVGRLRQAKKRADAKDLLAHRSTSFLGEGKDVFSALEAYRREAEMWKRCAQMDGATGLYNKNTTERLIAQALLREQEDFMAMLLIDIDDLKAINDTFGHRAGDDAIDTCAQLIKKNFHDGIVGRVGGDEFMVFLSGIKSGERANELAAELTQQLNRQPFGKYRDKSFHASVGMTVARGSSSFTRLYQQADQALYEAKRMQKGGFVVSDGLTGVISE